MWSMIINMVTSELITWEKNCRHVLPKLDELIKHQASDPSLDRLKIEGVCYREATLQEKCASQAQEKDFLEKFKVRPIREISFDGA